MPQFCAHCGAQLVEDASFCHVCGKPKAGQREVSPEQRHIPDAEPSEQSSSPSTAEPSFGHVFSVTWKVLLALALIAAVVVIVRSLIIGISNQSVESSNTSWDMQYDSQKADQKPTTMPQSKWNQFVAAAIKAHCPAEGMTKAEVEQAIGKPQVISGNEWEYSRTIKKNKCLKYSGDTCVQYETDHEQADFYFSAAGHLIDPALAPNDPTLPIEDIDGGWIRNNCFSEPFYSKYFQVQ